jgi:6-phosphogluconolactonase
MDGFKIPGGKVEIWRDAEEISRRAAELFVGLAREAIAHRGRFNVALAGGSTPRRTYESLVGEDYVTRVDWEQVHFFWSDERCVPPTDPESNYLMAAEALLNPLHLAPGQIHRMHGEDEPPGAAAAYEKEVRRHFGADGPHFDLIYLGMGDDGHTASLFPGTDALQDREHLVAAPWVEKVKSFRLTFTLPTLNAAAQVIFLTAGSAKAQALKEVLTADDGGKRLPASLVRPVNGELLWLVDEAAAALVER